MALPKPYYENELGRLYHGDCLDILPHLEPVDLVLTDPPYGLGFMGVKWDTYGDGKGRSPSGKSKWDQVGGNSHARKPGGQELIRMKENRNFQHAAEKWFVEVLRVAKPGAHLFSFGGTRTFHRLACAIEDAGWEIRDTMMWVYGSGFPKSLDVSKAIDKAAGAERELTKPGVVKRDGYGEDWGTGSSESRPRHDAPASAAAHKWQGYGTALKPAWEPIIIARRPLIGTVADNVLTHGTGALNIDGARVGVGDRRMCGTTDKSGESSYVLGSRQETRTDTGRWPANLIHDGSAEVVGLFPVTGLSSGGRIGKKTVSGVNIVPAGKYEAGNPGFGDTGSAARFFYTSKASRRDRHKDNKHPTVKPFKLIRYLCRMASRRGQVVLDPFAGSGTLAVVCEHLNRRWVCIELDEANCQTAVKRIEAERRQLKLF